MVENQEDAKQLELDIQLFSNSKQQGAVECLGLTFESDEARREYFLEKLREKLKEPDFRQIEGFPIGEDEDILALSDPPYYTACPNPFIEDFIRYWNQEKENNCLVNQDTSADAGGYHREPFAADVSEGKMTLFIMLTHTQLRCHLRQSYGISCTIQNLVTQFQMVFAGAE